MKIIVTKSAAEHFARLLHKHDKALGIRLGVKNSGCAQYSYDVDFMYNEQPDAHLIEQHGVKFFIPSAAITILDGTTVDYVLKGIGKIVVFDNPNAENACGCGESFSVKDKSE